VAAFRSGVSIDIDKLGALGDDAAMEIVDAAARELAFEVLQRAVGHLERQVYTRPNVVVTADKMATAREPTGALWNSGYVRTYTGQLPPGCPDEATATSAAKAKNPDVAFGQAPPGPARLGQAQVLFAAIYAFKVEHGTLTGIVPRPFLAPAAWEVQEFAEPFVRAQLRRAGFRV